MQLIRKLELLRETAQTCQGRPALARQGNEDGLPSAPASRERPEPPHSEIRASSSWGLGPSLVPAMLVGWLELGWDLYVPGRPDWLATQALLLCERPSLALMCS